MLLYDCPASSSCCLALLQTVLTCHGMVADATPMLFAPCAAVIAECYCSRL
jgi:hypothetical protein